MTGIIDRIRRLEDQLADRTPAYITALVTCEREWQQDRQAFADEQGLRFEVVTALGGARAVADQAHTLAELRALCDRNRVTLAVIPCEGKENETLAEFWAED